MAERDQVGRLFRGHDAGELRHREHVTFGCLLVADQLQGRGLHDDAGLGRRYTLGDVLGADINHAGVAALIEMGEVAHAACFRISRTAASTSGLRMKLSPIRNALAPTRAMRARSAGEPSPLSATSTRS